MTDIPLIYEIDIFKKNVGVCGRNMSIKGFGMNDLLSQIPTRVEYQLATSTTHYHM